MSRATVRMPGERQFGLAGAALAAVGYVVLRAYVWIAHESIASTGALSYESYYPLAFARELRREGHWLLFQNPYGSLDPDARLFYGPAAVARVLLPIWDGRELAFDFAAGLVCVVVAGWFFGRLTRRLSAQGDRLTLAILAIVVLGGGAGYVHRVIADGGLGGTTAPLLWASSWGPTWDVNNMLTWEILYHAVFWAGLWGAVAGRGRLALAAAVGLVLLHPFTSVIFTLTLTALFATRWIRRLDAPPPGSPRLFAAAIGVGVVGAVVWAFVWPELSNDAAYFRDTYDARPYVIGSRELLLYLLPVLTLLAGFAALRDPATPPRAHAVGLVMTSAVLLGIAFSHHVTSAFPQPAHWVRVYPVALLALAALAIPLRQAAAQWAGALTVVVMAVSLLDSGLAHMAIANDFNLKQPPVVLSSEQRAMIGYLRELEPARIVYLRRCADPPAPTSLEYTISALTDHKPPFGHVAFSPHLARRVRATQTCETPAAVAARHVVIADVDVGSVTGRRISRRFGDLLVFPPREDLK